MSDIVMLQGPESQTVLEMVVRTQSPAIMSYLSKDKWHVAKVVLKNLQASRLYVENCHTSGKLHPINVRMDQPVGMNFKHAYGKFVFDTTVVGLEPSSDPEAGGTIVLATPQRIGVNRTPRNCPLRKSDSPVAASPSPEGVETQAIVSLRGTIT